MKKHYVMDKDGSVRSVANVLEWAKQFESADRRIAFTDTGDGEVSTVFLGLDHNFCGKGPPILFETLIFRTSRTHDQDMWRYGTKAKALVGHGLAVNLLRARIAYEEACKKAKVSTQ